MRLRVERRDVPIEDILLDKDNPNWHTEEEVEAVARSIEELFRLHDPIGYYDENGKCRLICGELRVRAEIRNGAKVIEGMKILLDRPTERLIRELQAIENIQRRLDWVSRAEHYLMLQEQGMSATEIAKLIGFDVPATIRDLTTMARLLRRLPPELVEQLRSADAYQKATRIVAHNIGTRRTEGEVLTDKDVAIAEEVLRMILDGKLSQDKEAVRSAVLERKLGDLEKLFELERKEREEEVARLLEERSWQLKAELENQQKAVLTQKTKELEEYYQKLLTEKDESIKALEARLQHFDKQEVEAIAKLRQALEEERKNRRQLQENLEAEREAIRKEIEEDFRKRQEVFLEAERKKIWKQVERAMAEREAKLREEERRLEIEQRQLERQQKTLRAQQERLEDKSLRIHHFVKELIARRAELSSMVVGATDERFLRMLEEEEKKRLLESFKDGIRDDLQLISQLKQVWEERTDTEDWKNLKEN